MENATKALIISASVLIAIVLIAIGIRILGILKPTTEQVGKVSNSLEVSVYNSQFVNYEGNQKGDAVKALLRLIKQNNITEDNKIKINGVEKSNDALNTFIEGINVTKIYGISFSTNDQGYVDNVNVEG